MSFLSHQKEPKNGAQTAGKRNSVSLKFRFGRELLIMRNTGRCFSKIFRVGTSQTSLQAPNPKYFVAHPPSGCVAHHQNLFRANLRKSLTLLMLGVFVGSARLAPNFFIQNPTSVHNHSTIRSPHPADVEGQGLLFIEDSAESNHNVVPNVLHRRNKGRKFYQP